MYIPIVLGTARAGRQSEKVAGFVLGETRERAELETEIVDVRDYHIHATDNTEEISEAKRWAEKVVKAAGFIIVTPEYNHTYPGELKMFLDMLYKQYFKKPVGICGVSNGPWGGTRGVQALRLTLVSLGMHPILETVYFPNVNTLFDEQGRISDLSYKKKVKGMLDSLIWHAGKLAA